MLRTRKLTEKDIKQNQSIQNHPANYKPKKAKKRIKFFNSRKNKAKSERKKYTQLQIQPIIKTNKIFYLLSLF